MDVELRIILNSAGLVQVAGPIGNKVLCYGILEAAKDAVRDYKAPATPSLIAEVPLANGTNLLKKGK